MKQTPKIDLSLWPTQNCSVLDTTKTFFYVIGDSFVLMLRENVEFV